MRLTDREQEVLERVARGQTNKEIAADLGISIQAVKIHVSAMLRRFAVPNRAALVVMALRQGMLDEDQTAPAERGTQRRQTSSRPRAATA